jgi:hypothetical protein
VHETLSGKPRGANRAHDAGVVWLAHDRSFSLYQETVRPGDLRPTG